MSQWLVLAPLAGLAFNVVVQAALTRAKLRLPVSIVSGFLGGIVAASALTAYTLAQAGIGAPDLVALLTLNLVTSGALGFGYANFVNLNGTSIRIRILKEIQAAGSLSLDELAKRYDDKALIENRIDRLLRGRQIVERNGRYYTGLPFLLLIARTIGALKWVVLGRSFDLGSSPSQALADRADLSK